MNISESEASAIVVAKTCGCKEQQDGKKVTYAFIDSYHNICIDKKDIISSELDACEKLVRYTTDQTEKQVIERDIRIEDHVRPFTLIISVRLHIYGDFLIEV